jgi:hypothetical protein
VIGPESNAGLIAAARLQKANVPLFRTTAGVTLGGRAIPSGAWIVPPTAAARGVLEGVTHETGLEVLGADAPLEVDGIRLKPGMHIGLWRGANNMAGGWMMWTLEQYGISHRVISAADFGGDLSTMYDAILLPGGISRDTIVRGLDPAKNDKEFAWANGVGDAGWKELAQWVRDGGTLVAIGDSVETARQLLDLPIAKVLPEAQRRRRAPGGAPGGADEAPQKTTAEPDANELLREAFSSPARLAATLRDRVIEPESLFYCPGSLLQNDFDTKHPVGAGLPSSWPVFFESDQAYRLTPSFDFRAEVVARYPLRGPILRSGWLLGEDLLRDHANVIAFRVGKGYVVTLGTQVAFRAQARATYKLVFNALFYGPSTPVTARELAQLPPATHPSTSASESGSGFRAHKTLR